MSVVMIVSVLLFLLIVFWQFGSRLSPRYAITWWLGAVFLLFCTVFPSALGPVAGFLGIEIISNFVIAGLLLFLFFQSMDLTADISKSNRTIRKLIAEDAAQSAPLPVDHLIAKKALCLVVLPCFNEEASIEAVINKLRSNIANDSRLRFLIVDDGSTDDTKSKLSLLAPNNHVSHKSNIGVAGVLLTGFRYARLHGFNYIAQCDADGQHPVDRISELLNHAVKLNSDLLIGSRFVDGAKGGLVATTVTRYLGISVLRATLLLFGWAANITDPTSGFRIYSARAASVLAKDMPDEYPEPESIAILSQSGLIISEYPMTMSPRVAGVSSISGLKQVRYLAKVTTALIGLRLRRIF